MRPGDRGAGKQQDDRVVERQVERVDDLDACRRPFATGKLRACNLCSLAGEEACIEEGPEPGHEEHQLGSDEHDHAVAQMQRHNAGVMPLMGFLHRVGPPGKHGVKHDQQTGCEDPEIGRGEIHAEELEGLPCSGTHPCDAAKGHDQCAHGSEERPRARINDVIVVVFSFGASHIIPRSSGSLLFQTAAPGPCSDSADKRYRKA